MIPTIPSYANRQFLITDNQSLIRNPNNLAQSARYRAGDPLPPGVRVGDKKEIPLNTWVNITGIRTDKRRNAFVHAVPIEEGTLIPSGWTKATNLEAGFVNELTGFIPTEWDRPPFGENYTVIDKNALIRSAPPHFNSLGKTIPYGTYVIATGRSRQTDPQEKFIRVRHLQVIDDRMEVGAPIGWTHSSNLVEGNAPIFKTDEWLETKGPNAAWRRGTFIGAKILVGIVGTGGQVQHIALETLDPYWKLMQEAAKERVAITITSAFRTFGKQAYLFDGWEKGLPGFNKAAPPGRSNHQNGIAFDLNTTGFDGTLVYDWLKHNATRFGFIRTVNKEHWHWEYQPVKAAELRARGTFKLNRVTR